MPDSTAACRLGRKLGRLALITCLAIVLPPRHPSGVTLALLGDIMLGRGIAAAAAAPADVLGNLAPYLDSADLLLANLESPLSQSSVPGTSGYVLCAPPSQILALEAAGFDLLSLANNHSLDCGNRGLEETRAALLAAGIQPIGPEPHLVYRQLGSTRLAFMALDDISTPVPLVTATHVIAQAHASGRQVIVSIHWGAEYQPAPNARQRAIADQLIQAGATLVWGHHPHVLQPVERADCDLPGGCLVVYSLGNAVFDQIGLADTRRSAVVFVRVSDRGVVGVRAVPFSIDVRQGRLTMASPIDADAVLQRLGSEVQ